MRRILLGAGVLALAFAANPAGAYFVEACAAPSTPAEMPVATVIFLDNGDGNFEFRGHVVCKDASITITSVVLTQTAPQAGPWSAPPASCVTTCTTSALAPAGPGIWRMHMTFDVSGQGRTYTDRFRCRMYYTTGSGHPPQIMHTSGTTVSPGVCGTVEALT